MVPQLEVEAGQPGLGSDSMKSNTNANQNCNDY